MAYCTYCGSELEKDAAFCINCGQPVDDAVPSHDAAPVAASSAPMAAGNTPAAAPPAPKSGKNSKVIVAVVIVVAVVVIAAVALLGRSCSTQEPAAAPSGAAVETTEAEPAETEQPADEPEPAEPVPAFDASASVDLTSPDTVAAVNLFLSNFTEKGALMNGYRYESADDLLLADFSTSHIYINDPSAVHEGMGEGTEEVEGSVFLKYPKIFLKQTLANDDLWQLPEPYGCFEGYAYLDPGRISRTPQGVAFVTGSRDAGGGRTEVSFDIYWNGASYTATDKSWYNGSLDELKSKMGVSEPVGSGTAVIEPHEDGTSASYLLWSYDSTR